MEQMRTFRRVALFLIFSTQTLFLLNGEEGFLDHTELLFGREIRVKMAPESATLLYGGHPCIQISEPQFDSDKDDWFATWQTAPLWMLRTRTLEARFPGRTSFRMELEPDQGREERIQIRLQRKETQLIQMKRYATGENPKSVEFSPDGKWMAVANLASPWVDLIPVPIRPGRPNDAKQKAGTSADTQIRLKIPQFFYPEGREDKTSLVEICFLEKRKEMWVSQMWAKSSVHIFSTEDYRYLKSYPTGGNWSKVLTADAEEERVYVANWLSGDISVLSTSDGRIIAQIPVTAAASGGGVPRGLAFSEDGKILYAANFTAGCIDRISTGTLKLLKPIRVDRFGAKRHLVTDYPKNRLYVSDMAKREIQVFNLIEEKLVKRIKVYHKPNTIALTPCGSYLLVSCRGSNNPQWYTFEGRDFGRICLIDTDKLEMVDWIHGWDQPTGLAIHPEGKLAAYTNFKDRSVELIDLRGLY